MVMQAVQKSAGADLALIRRPQTFRKFSRNSVVNALMGSEVVIVIDVFVKDVA
jgi:hypothetical protein